VLISPRIGGAKLKGGKLLAADGQLAGTPSVTVDAVALVLAPAAAEMLCKDGTAVQFVMDGYGHLKAIGASEGAQVLLQKAGAEKDKGVIGLGEDFIKNAGRRFWDREPRVRTLA
jgi:catalase